MPSIVLQVDLILKHFAFSNGGGEPDDAGSPESILFE
jgi:hypothetical protein